MVLSINGAGRADLLNLLLPELAPTAQPQKEEDASTADAFSRTRDNPQMKELEKLLQQYAGGNMDLQTLIEMVSRRLGSNRQSNDLGSMSGLRPWQKSQSLGSNGWSPGGKNGTQSGGITPVQLPPGSDKPLTGDSKVTAEKLNQQLKGAFAGKGEAFVRAGKANGVDPALLAAIAMHETGNGTSNAVRNKNNPGGLMNPKTNWQTLQQFASLEHGLHAMAGNLKRNYLNKGRQSIASIGPKYAPVGAKNDPRGLNGHWVSGVTSNYNRLVG